jgi:hypothetical protein
VESYDRSVERTPLVETYKFPVSQPRDIRAVCDPSMPLLPEDEPLHENLSAVQGGPRFDKIEKRIRMADRGQFVRELVTGHAGSGKSTELLRLAARLRQLKGTQEFHVVYLDAFEHLSQWGMRLPHILIALLAGLAEQERVDLKETRSAKSLIGRIKALVGSISSEIAKQIDSIAHISILTALLRTNQEFSSKFQHQAVAQIQDLLRLLNDLVAEVARDLNVDIVFIVDNLEKVPEQSAEGYASLHEALFVRDLPLLDISAHLVLTYPISLNYSNAELPRAFPSAGKTTLPMVVVRSPPATHDRGDDAAGIAALRQLLLRRVKQEVFADHEAIEHLIRSSGGCVRDLMRFVRELPIVADPPFTREHVDLAIRDFKNDYERILLGKPYVRHLPAIEQSGQIPDELPPDAKREILLGLVVLEYDTDTWFDVHPLVKRTRAFTAARNG